jgi:hypothetical protein
MSLSFIRGAAGVMILLLGRELSFLFSGAMAGFLAFRLTPFLPSAWPSWSGFAFVLAIAVIAGILTSLNESAGFYISGFFIGGYVLTEYYAPDSLAIPIIPFIIGSVLGAVILGVFTDWAMIIVSTFIGTYLIYGILPLFGIAKTLASAGIFIVGGLAQVIIFQSQKHSDR